MEKFSVKKPLTIFVAVIAVLVLGVVAFIVVAIGAIKLLWPVLLVVFILWLLSKALNS